MVIPGPPTGDPRDGPRGPAVRGRNPCTRASGKWVPGSALWGRPGMTSLRALGWKRTTSTFPGRTRMLPLSW
jgi:hypothetical protein